MLLPRGASGATAGPAIWFAPLPPLYAAPYLGSSDFMDLFRKNAAWPHAAPRVSVFKFYSQWVVYKATVVQRRQVVNELKRRKISIAIETGPLKATPDCGGGEGFAGGEGIAAAILIKAAGGKVSYVAFDEPFFYGGLWTGDNACHWDGRRIAQRISEYMRELRTIFPDVKFGDIEPVTTGAHVERYKQWIDTFRQVTGENLAFLHLDLWYSLAAWPRLAGEIEKFARSRGVPFGVIYTGDGTDRTDSAWLSKAQKRFELYETEAGHPEQAVFQSWMDKPDRVLPERKRTFTNLILRYVRPRTRLDLEAHAGVVEGSLRAGGPLVHAGIGLSAERVYEGSAYATTSVRASATATTAADGRFRVQLSPPPGATIVGRYPGSIRYWPAYAAAGSGAPLRNVARGKTVRASTEQTTTPAAFAVDGDTTTTWNAGQFPSQWIEVDLGAPLTVAAIRLGVAQTPRVSNTVHAVLGRPPEGSYRELHIFDGQTSDGEVLEYVPEAPWEGIRYLRVETRASPSWVAWREIEVFAAD